MHAQLVILILGISVASLAAAGWLARWVLARDTGTKEMRTISDAIKEGAEAFLRRQNRTIVILAAALAAVIFVLYGFVRGHHEFDPVGSRIAMATWITISFALGAACSVVAGYVGMWVSIRTNIRTASAARTSLNDALRVALRGGAVSGLFVVAMSLLGVGGLYALVEAVTDVPPEKIPLLIVGYGFGASFVALFAQLGGGIYTKAADVGADLVGKVEAGIPEDDPRNPAVVADLVGDNVGDCAGRGADIFESSIAEMIGAMVLGAGLFLAAGGDPTGREIGFLFFPLVVPAFGLIASLIGMLSVKPGANVGDPMDQLNKGFYVSAGLSAVLVIVASYWILPVGKLEYALCGLVGIVTSLLFVYITQYYTSGRFRPVQSIMKSSETGPATNIISGISVGFETTGLPAITIGAALLVAYFLGERVAFPVTEGLFPHSNGIFGTAVATMGMLMTAAYVLAMDTFGPITDNAGGVVEMSNQPDSVRDVTDALDSAGNTTKALTKGYAVGTAALAAFLLFSAFLQEVQRFGGSAVAADVVNLANPKVFVGGLLGAMLVYVFASLAMRAVSRAAGDMIAEVRRQFRQDPGIMAGTSRPDYEKCVDISVQASLREMVLPGVLAVAVPILVGVILGWEAAAGMLMIGTISGVLLANVLNNGGGAWDNAKKMIEAGYLKDAAGNVLGKGSAPHAAAVVGDTVGDPWKDTAGPSLHVLIKLLATITLVLAPLFLR